MVATHGHNGMRSLIIFMIININDEISIAHSSDTSRVPKSNELEGREYYFRTKEEMLERIRTGDMIEWGELDGQLYGTRFLHASVYDLFSCSRLFHQISNKKIFIIHYEA